MTEFDDNDGFEDTDNDGVAELQDSHTDHQGGDARNIGEADVGTLVDGAGVSHSGELADAADIQGAPPAFKAGDSSSTSLSANTWTTVALTDVYFDTDGMQSADDTGFVAPDGGFYWVRWGGKFRVGTAGDVLTTTLRDNSTGGAVPESTYRLVAPGSTNGYVMSSVLLDATAGTKYYPEWRNVDSSDTLDSADLQVVKVR